jgi:16S rRNA processing protein RimM
VTAPRRTSISSTTDPLGTAGAPEAPDAADSTADPSSTLLEVGRIAKPHGLGGEVVVALLTNRTERLDEGSQLATPTGRILTVTRSRPFKNRWIVSFAEIGDLDAVEHVRGTLLLAERLDEPGALWVHDLVGQRVEDRTGRLLGQVKAVLANPASDLLELDGGGLVPLVFVVENLPDRIVVDIPDGLIE